MCVRVQNLRVAPICIVLYVCTEYVCMIYAGACRRGAGKGEGGSGAILRKAMQVCM